ncbi:MAG: acylneuraminate cytidylyltransferase family protein [Alphaproteobacteria bacterium]
MRRIATICARGGSMGVPGKNVRPLGGKPLLVHTVEQARDTGIFDAIAVSSDDDGFLRIAAEWGVEHLVKRPDELATDAAPKVPAIRHCMQAVEARLGTAFDIVADLSVTAPLRSAADIRGAIEMLEASDAQNVTMGTLAHHSPYSGIVELVDGKYARISKTVDSPIYARQAAPLCYEQTGGFYAWRRDALFEQGDYPLLERTLLYEIPEERGLDIDSEFDFHLIGLLFAEARQGGEDRH